MKLRGGTAESRIETGRWCGLKQDGQICKIYDEGEVEDVEHFWLHGIVWQRRERRWCG